MCGKCVINMKRKAFTPSEYTEYKTCLYYPRNSGTAPFCQDAWKPWKKNKNLAKRTYTLKHSFTIHQSLLELLETSSMQQKFCMHYLYLFFWAKNKHLSFEIHSLNQAFNPYKPQHKPKPVFSVRLRLSLSSHKVSGFVNMKSRIKEDSAFNHSCPHTTPARDLKTDNIPWTISGIV